MITQTECYIFRSKMCFGNVRLGCDTFILLDPAVVVEIKEGAL